jgi:hypothetical protein
MSDLAVGFSTTYALGSFSGTSIDEDGDFRGAARYSKGVSVEERQVFGGLDDNHTVNTAAELLAMVSALGIQDVKKEDALKLYTEIAMEGAVNKFLGVQGRTHEQVLARLKSKYNFTEAEINSTIRATVAEIVDTEFNKEGMRGGIIPAVVYAQWKQNKIAGGADAVQTVKNVLSNFFINPTSENYQKLTVIRACYRNNRNNNDDQLALFSGVAYTSTLNALSETLRRKIDEYAVANSIALVQRAESDRELFVFSIPYAIGGSGY